MSDRTVFIISDLHVGGRGPSEDEPRGFRMLTRSDALTSFIRTLAAREGRTELVINGDFVDFLAEDGDGSGWLPFASDPDDAERRLTTIMKREAALFDALRGLLAAGHRLTVLLGNHDIELSLPRARRALLERLGADEDGRLRFIYDGEAYVVGDAIIEHGNRYDGFNVIDHDALRRLRSAQSRGLEDERAAFNPPAGSFIVSEIMNGIKSDYPFVDLLKPETEAVVPLLLAIDPGLRQYILGILSQCLRAKAHEPMAPGKPAHVGDIAAHEGYDNSSADGAEDLLEDVVAQVMGRTAAASFLRALPMEPEQLVGEIASAGISTGLTILRLAARRRSGEIEARLPLLLEGLRCVQNDRSFDRAHETNPHLMAGAVALANAGFRWIIFGHTHLAKQVAVQATKEAAALGYKGDATYLNTGTWADLMRFPTAILSGTEVEARAALAEFVQDLVTNGYQRWISFEPTYVRLDCVGAYVTSATLETYSG